LTDSKPIKYCKNIWPGCQMPALGWFFQEDNCGHPGYTSVDICRRVISNFSSPYDTVLDCFNGTGSSCVAAKQLGRKFIGIEISQKYCDIAIQRLQQEILL
jgi:DNA modification methylase